MTLLKKLVVAIDDAAIAAYQMIADQRAERLSVDLGK
jgi:hypothetical protein